MDMQCQPCGEERARPCSASHVHVVWTKRAVPATEWPVAGSQYWGREVAEGERELCWQEGKGKGNSWPEAQVASHPRACPLAQVSIG